MMDRETKVFGQGIILGVAFTFAFLVLAHYGLSPSKKVASVPQDSATCDQSALKQRLMLTGVLPLHHTKHLWSAEYQSKANDGISHQVSTQSETVCGALKEINARLDELN